MRSNGYEETISRSVISILAAAAVLIVGVMVLLWSMQERIAYQPPAVAPAFANGAQRVEYRAADGQPLFGFVVGDPEESAGLLLAFHGNADLAVWQLQWARDVATRTGYAVFLPEYRGYMGLPGRPTYSGIRQDAAAAYRFVRDSLRVGAHTIAMFGHSLGTAVAAELAAEYRPRALLLQAPFTSTRDMASRMVSTPLATLLQFVSRIPYDTRTAVSRIEAPTWVIHGKRDLIIPARMGRSVYDAVKHKGGFVVIDDAGHNDVGVVDRERYWKWMTAALASYEVVEVN